MAARRGRHVLGSTSWARLRHGAQVLPVRSQDGQQLRVGVDLGGVPPRGDDLRNRRWIAEGFGTFKRVDQLHETSLA